MIDRLINEITSLTNIIFVDYDDEKETDSIELLQTGRIISNEIEVDFTLHIYMVDTDCIDRMAIIDKAVSDDKLQEYDGYNWIANGIFFTKSFKIFVDKTKLIGTSTGKVSPRIIINQKQSIGGF